MLVCHLWDVQKMQHEKTEAKQKQKQPKKQSKRKENPGNTMNAPAPWRAPAHHRRSPRRRRRGTAGAGPAGPSPGGAAAPAGRPGRRRSPPGPGAPLTPGPSGPRPPGGPCDREAGSISGGGRRMISNAAAKCAEKTPPKKTHGWAPDPNP